MSDTHMDPNSLLDAIREYGLESMGIYYGNYRGTIVDRKDPQQLGRVKVRVHQITGDSIIEAWAWPKGQPCGEDWGDFAIPPQGSPVWVEFENGDPQHPIWNYGHWAKENGVVPEEAKRSDPTNVVRKTEKWLMEMDDENEIYRITRQDGNVYIEFLQNGNINIKGEDITVMGENIEFQANTDITLNAGNNIILGALNITLDGSTGLGITSTGPVTMSSSAITMSATGAIAIDGSATSIEGKDFINHQHTGVTPGGGTSGGVA